MPANLFLMENEKLKGGATNQMGLAMDMQNIETQLEELKAQGESFDPNYHHAVSELEHEEIESGMILEQFQKGYTFNQRLIRPAMVVVSKGKPIESSNHGESPEGEG